MWQWILGGLGVAGALAVAAHAGRSKRKRNGPDASAAPRLAPAEASYWHALELDEAPGLAEAPGLDDAKAKRRREARARQIEALARIIASEAGPMSRTVKRTVGWLARNRSIHIKRAMFDMAAPDGRWGPIAATRPMASTQPPTDETRAIAAAVLDAPQAQDPTRAATYGFDMSLQDRLAEQGIVANDAAGVIRSWETFYGLRRVGQVEKWALYR